jgi:mannosyl-glycoprotein endo-beta-N-acetylglucosaminidase
MNDANSKDPFEPTIKPMTVDDFNTWPNLIWVTDASVARIPLATRLPLDKDGPSSMVGFDNGGTGGWQYDPWFTQWSQGGHGKSDDGNRTAANVYNFSFWQYLDICYYFGHDLLTIPPTVWTNAAHKSGVSSLGTLNLDSLVSKTDKDLPVLEFLRNGPYVVERMYAIASYFNFDGYLFNYEYSNGPNESEIAVFIRWIMQKLNQVGEDNKKLVIVWYDSPISAPKGGWFQNRLTESAKDFFLDAGRFQANYSWGPAFPGTENYPELSGQLAEAWGRPRNDVTMMLDCYERGWRDTRPYYTDNFFSALELVWAVRRPAYYTGLGCYAPGWIAFNGLSRNTEKLRPRHRFHQNDRAFWAGTADFQREGPPPDFPPVGPPINPWPAQCMAHYVEERSVVTATPFATTFNSGEGDFYNIDGKRWADTPWNNLSDQSVLPTWQFRPSGSAHGKAEIDYADAFTGGSCIRITGSVNGKDHWDLLFLLYKTNVLYTTTPQTLTLTVKPAATYTSKVCGAVEVDHVLQERLHPNPKRDINGWQQWDFDLRLFDGKAITAVGIWIQNYKHATEDFTIWLGHLAFTDRAHMPPTPQNLPMQPDEAGVLNWSQAYRPGSHYRIWGERDGEKYLLGVAYNYVYSTYKTIFNTDRGGFTRYIVQEVNSAGQYTPL